MEAVKTPPAYCHLMVLIGIASELEWKSLLKMKLILKLNSHFSRINNGLPFIQVPRAMTPGIIGDCDLHKIIYALDACLKLKRSYRSDSRRIFSKQPGERIKFCCAGIQVSRNSKKVHDHAPFMENLLQT
jgi:hypothetical protein